MPFGSAANWIACAPSALFRKSLCVHTPGEKLLDAFLVILAGYPSLYLLNTALRPVLLLAQAWHRTALADQSSE